MKVTIEHMGHKVTMEDEAVVDICDAIDLIEKALWEAGYDRERVSGALVVKAKEIEGQRE